MQSLPRCCRPIVIGLATLLLCQSAVAAQAGTPGPPDDPPGREISLRAAVDLILERNPLTRAKRLDVERARLDVTLFDKFWALPQFTFNGLTGVVPAARGDIFDSPDTSGDLGNLGPFFRANVGLAIPIYTFGRLRNAANLARGGLRLEEAKSLQTQNELALEVIKAYWGLVASERAFGVAEDMRDSYDSLLEKVDEKLEADEMDSNDAYQAQAGEFDVDKAYLDAVEMGRVVQHSLAVLLGEDSGVALLPTNKETPEIQLQVSDLERLVAIAELTNPELVSVREAIGALEAATKLERSNRWPMVLVGATFGIAQASGRDDQKNPFAFDEFNYKRIGAAFNVKWNLNFTRNSVEVAKRQIARDSTAAKAEALRGKIGIEVYQALERVLKNVQLVDSAKAARRFSRRWLRTAFDSWDLGIGEAQPMLKAYAADYRLQAQVVETQYQLDVSLAELALVTGDLHSYLRWIADGTVALK